MHELRDRHVLVTGGTGFLGQHVVTELRKEDAMAEALGKSDVDLTNTEQTFDFFYEHLQADSFVVHLAYPGSTLGIETSVRTPFTLISQLQLMDLNVIRACAEFGVKKLLCIGSVCAYPEHTDLPTTEAQLWMGYPEPVNAAYGLAKRAQLGLLYAARHESKLNGVHLIAANMYGPGDRSGHVIPSLITRMRESKVSGAPLTVWGQPDVSRSFLYVRDAALGIVRTLERYDEQAPLNLVSGEETMMEGLIAKLSGMLDYTGVVQFDTSKPTGHKRRWFSRAKLMHALDWVPGTSFTDGLQETVNWHLANVELL